MNLDARKRVPLEDMLESPASPAPQAALRLHAQFTNSPDGYRSPVGR